MHTTYSLLLTDGTGLTSRQVATQAAAAGHSVDVVTPSRLAPARFTRHVRRVFPVPAFGRDPDAWLAATLNVLRRERYDVLLPTQEQAALLARDAGAVRELGVGLAVPSFAALCRVQDKVAQAQTLAALGLPHPATRVVWSAAELLDAASPPVFVKTPIGTASSGVWSVRSGAALRTLALRLDYALGVVVQAPAPGRLIMVQAVFADGELVAWHANTREREGIRGGAVSKCSIAPTGVEAELRALGAALRWHGALSLDARLNDTGPSYIDINPRLVEPGNAWQAGVDLVAALIAVSLGERPALAGPGRPGVRTHQMLLGVLDGAASGGRRAVARELLAAARKTGSYAGSAEELTPVRGDLRAVIPVAVVAAASLVRPAFGERFSGGAVSAYALTDAAWTAIRSRRNRGSGLHSDLGAMRFDRV